MLTIATALAMTASPPTQPFLQPGVTAQARAIVRIVSAVSVRLGEGSVGGEGPPAQHTVVHTDGLKRPARLVEFQ